jgi:hypothetical protein
MPTEEVTDADDSAFKEADIRPFASPGRFLAVFFVCLVTLTAACSGQTLEPSEPKSSIGPPSGGSVAPGGSLASPGPGGNPGIDPPGPPSGGSEPPSSGPGGNGGIDPPGPTAIEPPGPTPTTSDRPGPDPGSDAGIAPADPAATGDRTAPARPPTPTTEP